MTRAEVISQCKAKCPYCASGLSVTMHLGDEWIHSTVQRGQHTVTACQATDIRNEYKEILDNG